MNLKKSCKKKTDSKKLSASFSFKNYGKANPIAEFNANKSWSNLSVLYMTSSFNETMVILNFWKKVKFINKLSTYSNIFLEQEHPKHAKCLII